MDIATGRETALTSSEKTGDDLQPALSPDGQTLAFLRKHDASLMGLILLDLKTRKERMLIHDWGPTNGLTWDRNGRELVLASNRKGDGYALWRVPLEGTPVQMTLPLDPRPDQPVMSPTGQLMAFVVFDGSMNLARMRGDTAGSGAGEKLYTARQANLAQAV